MVVEYNETDMKKRTRKKLLPVYCRYLGKLSQPPPKYVGFANANVEMIKVDY